MIIHVTRLARAPDFLHPIDTYHQLPPVATYAVHISEHGKDVPVDWIFNRAAIVAEGSEWPLHADKCLQDVWCCFVIGAPTPDIKLKVQLRDHWRIRLTDAQKLELQTTENVLGKSEFNERLCNLMAQNRSHQYFGRLFIEPAGDTVYDLTPIFNSEKVTGWQTTIEADDILLSTALNTL